MILEQRVQGIVPPVPTIFKDGKVDDAGIGKVHAFLRDNEITTFFYGGENGEARFLSNGQYRRLIDIVSEFQEPSVNVWMGIVRKSLADTRDLILYANKKGLEKTVIAPAYQEDYPSVAFAEAILDMTDSGIVIYNNPGISNGRMFPSGHVYVLINKYGKRIVAYKDSSAVPQNMEELLWIRDHGGAPWLSVFQGSEEAFIRDARMKAEGKDVKMGNDGLVSGTSDFAPKLMTDVWDAGRKGLYEPSNPSFVRLDGHHGTYREDGSSIPEIKRQLKKLNLIESPEYIWKKE